MSQEYYVLEKKKNVGDLCIGVQVFETIVENTLTKIDGISVENTNALSMSGSKGPVVVNLNKNNQLIVDLQINVDYGLHVGTITNTVQTKITTAFLEMTGMKNAKVNIEIKGINF